MIPGHDDGLATNEGRVVVCVAFGRFAVVGLWLLCLIFGVEFRRATTVSGLCDPNPPESEIKLSVQFVLANQSA